MEKKKKFAHFSYLNFFLKKYQEKEMMTNGKNFLFSSGSNFYYNFLPFLKF